MASLSLRAYLQKIENLIDRGETEQSIAHCKHVLKKFPKHVDTYRLLGKSYLEMQRYQEASDVLQRVLSVMPDDFVSQIGMSIIRESSENLDEAIWHMERAFEIQPSNNAVQDELKRLYGRRDGVIPQKILLTRGALVRMYVRGEAYPQAIAEGIAALKEEPQRADIQLLLAKSYLRTNQINEGYRICQNILESLPYSYEANQLIAEIHILTKQSDQAEPYLERVRMLDPYAAFVNENAPTSAKVDENSIIIDELDYDEFSDSFAQNGSAEKPLFIDDDFDTSSLEIPTAEDSQPIEIDEDFSWMQEMMNGTGEESKPSQSFGNETPKSDFDLSQDDSIFSDESTENESIFPTIDTNEKNEVNLFSEDEELSEEDEAFAALFDQISAKPDSSGSQSMTSEPQSQQPMSMAEFFESTIDGTSQAEPMNEAVPDAEFEAIFGQVNTEPKEGKQASSITEVEKPATDDLPDWLKELDQETQQSDIEDDLQKEIDSLFTNGDLSTSSVDMSGEPSSDTGTDEPDEFTAKFLQELEEEPQHPGKTRMFSMTASLSGGDSGPLPPLDDDMPPAEKNSNDDIPDWLKQLEDQTNEFSAKPEIIEEDNEELVNEEPILENQAKPISSSSIDSMTADEEDQLREQFLNAQQTSKATQMLSEEDDDSFAWLESLAAKQSAGEQSAGEQSADELRFGQEISTTMEEDSLPDISEPKKQTSSIDSMSEEEEEHLRQQFLNAQQTSKATQMLSEDDDDNFAWLESLAAKQSADEQSAGEQSADEQSAGNTSDEDNLSINDIVEPFEQDVSEPVSQSLTTPSSIDSMSEEEEERLRQQYKNAQSTNKAAQMVSDDDDSFAWLESLAAKQSSYEQSADEQSADEQSADEQSADEQSADEQSADEQSTSEGTLHSSDEGQQVDLPEWVQESDVLLESNNIPARPEHTAILNGLDELETLHEDEPVTISKLEQSKADAEIEPELNVEEPIWVDEFATSENSTFSESLDSNEPGFSTANDFKYEEEGVPSFEPENVQGKPIEESQPNRIIEPPQTPDEIPEWLKDLEDKTSIYAMTDEDEEEFGGINIDDVEIPGWITDVNETQAVQLEDEESDLIPEVHAEYLSMQDESEEDDDSFSAMGLDIGELERKLEEEQIVEHIDTVSSLRDIVAAQEPASAQASTPEIEDDLELENIDEDLFDIPSDFVNDILQDTEPTGPTPVVDDDLKKLSEISSLISTNRLSDALDIADQLIEKEIYLQNIIDELNKAIVDHPLDPAIFIRLGDAYIRNNEIQKALDMYQEAETLLQK